MTATSQSQHHLWRAIQLLCLRLLCITHIVMNRLLAAARRCALDSGDEVSHIAPASYWRANVISSRGVLPRRVDPFWRGIVRSSRAHAITVSSSALILFMTVCDELQTYYESTVTVDSDFVP